MEANAQLVGARTGPFKFSPWDPHAPLIVANRTDTDSHDPGRLAVGERRRPKFQCTSVVVGRGAIPASRAPR